MLDQQQLISGIGILLAFFVGYRYGVKTSKKESEDDECKPVPTTAAASAPPVEKERVYSDMGDYKLVLVVRNDLKMGKGKIGAQCGHGAVGAVLKAMKSHPSLVRHWDNCGAAKIAVKVDSERDIEGIKKLAARRNLNYCLIRDAGRTQIAAGSATVLAIGPALVADIDEITGHLKLL
ncbi:unnamed protein product [Diamesa hyperborea]